VRLAWRTHLKIVEDYLKLPSNLPDGQSTTLYQVDDLQIDPVARTVMRDGDRIPLPKLSFDLLVTLLEASPTIISPEDLKARVWNARHVSEETMAQRISLLRKALGDTANDPRYIRTVRGEGYGIAGAVRAHQQPPSKSTSSRHLNWVAAFAAFTLVISAILLFAMPESSPERTLTAGPISHNELVTNRALDLLKIQEADETNRAITMLREAYASDPKELRTQLVLSFALSTRVTKFREQEGDRIEAEALARAALQKAPESSDAFHALAYALDSQGKIDQALAAYQTAYSLNPNDLTAMSGAAHLLQVRGRLHDALMLEQSALNSNDTSRFAEVQIAKSLQLLSFPSAQYWRDKAIALNPRQSVIIASIIEQHLHARNIETAYQLLDALPAHDRRLPRILHLEARAKLLSGDFAGALDAFEAAGARSEIGAAIILARSGEHESASLIRKELSVKFQQGDSWPKLRIELAELEAALGNNERVPDLINQAVDLGWRDIANIETSPFLEAFIQTAQWTIIKQRILTELNAQRRLVETTPELNALLAP